MTARLTEVTRRPATFAYLLLAGWGAFAVVDGVSLVTGAQPEARPAGAYVAAVGAVLLALTAAAAWPGATRAAEANLVASLADGVLEEEREAGRGSDRVAVEPEGLPVAQARRLLARAGGLVLLWIACLPFLGFAVGTALFLVLYSRTVSGRPLLRSVLFAVVAAGVMTALFSGVGVVLPRGSMWPY